MDLDMHIKKWYYEHSTKQELSSLVFFFQTLLCTEPQGSNLPFTPQKTLFSYVAAAFVGVLRCCCISSSSPAKVSFIYLFISLTHSVPNDFAHAATFRLQKYWSYRKALVAKPQVAAGAAGSNDGNWKKAHSETDWLPWPKGLGQ